MPSSCPKYTPGWEEMTLLAPENEGEHRADRRGPCKTHCRAAASTGTPQLRRRPAVVRVTHGQPHSWAAIKLNLACQRIAGGMLQGKRAQRRPVCRLDPGIAEYRSSGVTGGSAPLVDGRSPSAGMARVVIHLQ